MNILDLLSILIPTSVHQTHREVLEDSPRCGMLGDQDKRECFWGCQWVENPYYQSDVNNVVLEVVVDLLIPRMHQLSKTCEY